MLFRGGLVSAALLPNSMHSLTSSSRSGLRSFLLNQLSIIPPTFMGVLICVDPLYKRELTKFVVCFGFLSGSCALEVGYLCLIVYAYQLSSSTKLLRATFPLAKLVVFAVRKFVSKKFG